MTEDKKPFMVLEAVKELAQLRQSRDRRIAKVDDCQVALEETNAFEFLTGAEQNLGIARAEVIKAEDAFRTGCEDIYIKTNEKEYPGGKIKGRSTIEYDEVEAVKWAIEHEHIELLSIIKGKFKKMCSGINPLLEGNAFVKKGMVSKMYIDSDLSQYLEIDSDTDTDD